MLNLLEFPSNVRDKTEVEFYYTNWRGELALRTAIPIKIWFGQTSWHPEEQWFIRAFDVDKGEERDFALVDIRFQS
jgi:predicted DNA-binding transcriptional regulator YafY